MPKRQQGLESAVPPRHEIHGGRAGIREASRLYTVLLESLYTVELGYLTTNTKGAYSIAGAVVISHKSYNIPHLSMKTKQKVE